MSTPRQNALPAVRKLRYRLDELKRDLRSAAGDLEDAQARALAETAAEAVGGLVDAFSDYESAEEDAWDG